MILCSKLKNRLSKVVTKSQIVTEFDVTKSRLHRILKFKSIFWHADMTKKIYTTHFLDLFPDFKQISKIPKNQDIKCD